MPEGILKPDIAAKAILVTKALDDCRIRHAFGGAIANAYAGEPRATTAIDINIFVPMEDPEAVLICLEAAGVPIHTTARAEIAEEGQTRLLFSGTYVDLFFALSEFYELCDERAKTVQFESTTIRVLSAEDIVIFKTLFDRPRDWHDILMIVLIQAEGFDREYALANVAAMVGEEDSSYKRLRTVIETGELPWMA